MNYVLGYEISALIFLIVLMLRFFDMRRFPDEQNTLFIAVMWCAFADLLFDIFSSAAVNDISRLPLWANYLVLMAYYFLQTLFPALITAYVMLMTGRDRKKLNRSALLIVPLALFALILFTTPFTRLLFYLEYAGGAVIYAHARTFPLVYAAGAYYLAATLIYINTKAHRQKLTDNQHTTVTAVIGVGIAATAVQMAFPQALLIGVAVVIAIMLIYFTFQNPDDMLDYTTGAFNYGALLIFLGNLTRAQEDFYLIAADISGMRRINRLFGMDIGNKVLAGASGIFLNCGKQTWVFRMLGTRFVLITRSVRDYIDILDKISGRFRDPFSADGVDVMLCATVRHFYSAGRFSSVEGVISVVDTLFEDVPENEKGTIAAVDEILMTGIRRRLVLEAALRAAAETGDGFEIVFQPLFSVKTQRFPAAEVLLRFSCEDLGSVSPSEFIPIAEKNGLITKLDEIVIRKVCRFITKFCPTDFGLDAICLNLSAAEFFIPNTPERIRNIVDEYGADRSMIIFEITETFASAPFDSYSRYMHAMKEDGFRFALDDFGAGYSNVAQIANLPFSAIKLDKTLLFANRRRGATALVFEGVLQLSKQLGLITFVEGVESADDAVYVGCIGADYIQGYYYSPPLTEKNLIAFLEANNLS